MAKYQINYEALDEDKNKKNGTPYQELLEWVETIIFAFFAVILIFTFLLRQASVDGDSMNPTLRDGEKLIVNHLGYEAEAGDIVIIDCGDELGKAIVKRVIATEGQTVDIDFESGEVRVDGELLEEDYIAELTLTDEGGHSYPVTVPDGCVFVMGDNRNNSLDSRSSLISFVDEDDILGKVVFRIYPFEKIGTVE
ncbi:MAG: signal peptidase I [Oscillospiraceae bacterium]|nr:signal peptidase I [Oscillospiraceae bacterium]